MREIGAGAIGELTKLNEVFKYTGFGDCNYVLVARFSDDKCDGCVFYDNSGHPLSVESCTGNGLECSERIFKPIDEVLENI